MARNIEINIEELVLQGFDPGDRFVVGKALEQELTRLINEQDIPSGFSADREIPKVDAGTFRVSGDAKAGTIGIQTAKSVFNGLKL